MDGKIIVTGDVAIDWFELSNPPQASVKDEKKENWKTHKGIIRLPYKGGALLLAEGITKLMGGTPDCQVEGPSLQKPEEEISHEQMILSEAIIEYNKDRKAYYVKKPKGYLGPVKGNIPQCLHKDKYSEILKYPLNAKDTKLIVIDDAGNGFRNLSHLFPDTPDTIDPNTMVLYKMHSPLAQGGSWKWIKEKCDPEKLVTVINANDLRKIKEVDIASSLSWEKTAKDFSFHIMLNEYLATLSECANLIVVFDTDGAILYPGPQGGKSVLIFDPQRLEGGFRQEQPGDVFGKMTLFTSALAAALWADGIDGLEEGIKKGLALMRRLILYGYGCINHNLTFPFPKLYSADTDSACSKNEKSISTFAKVKIPGPSSVDNSDPEFWTILDYKTQNTRYPIAVDVLKKGNHETLKSVPEIQFGKALTTIDRSEIESYSGIVKLINEYIDNPAPPQPLCIAVFGSPGSGKSFGIKQIAQKVGREKIKINTFNLSQFNTYNDLLGAFHRTRDIGLSGNIPLVFFDEFDSDELKWLKYFLEPMQAGEFLDGEFNYHIGKAIFVFAGGTCFTFDEFAGKQGENKEKKLPDFISRLRGFINIMGPNPRIIGKGSEGQLEDKAFIIRRAKILRSLFVRSSKTKELFDSDQKTLHIDEGVLRAFLKVPEYKHGIRSMEAIIQMSRLVNLKIFDKAALPPRNQLDLHVNSEDFFLLIEKERFTSSLKDEGPIVTSIAKALHDDYIKNRKLKGEKFFIPEKFEDLPADKKNSNIHAARDIPNKLTFINCGIRPVKKGACLKTPIITEEQVEILSEKEHERYCREQKMQGWTFGKKRDNNARKNPNLIPYKDLKEEIKEYDREAVRVIPMILAQNGFELFKQAEMDAFEVLDPLIIENMAGIFHDEYCKLSKEQNGSLQKNSILVPFDKLDKDLKQSTSDSVIHIPSKLMEIGYGVRIVKRGKKAEIPKFSDDEIEKMARVEHIRWVWEHRLRGWVYKEGQNDQKNKTSPYLVPYDKLTDKIKDYDRKFVKLIPQVLAKVGYEVYKIKP